MEEQEEMERQKEMVRYIFLDILQGFSKLFIYCLFALFQRACFVVVNQC